MKCKKAELHLHLDGSLRPESVIDIAKLENIEIPTYDTDELVEYLRVDRENKDLVEYLKKFDIPCKVMQSKYSLERTAYELAEDLAREGYIYAEVRFAPHLHIKEGLKLEEVVEAVLEGLGRAMERYDISCNLLLCILRHRPTESGRDVLELAKKYSGRGVVGIDLAGDERSYPASLFEETFREAREAGIPFTIHAGEALGSESVWEAIRLGASRIGHGIRAYEDRELLEYLRDNEIYLECCPISNYQTKALEDFKNYPLKSYLDYGLKVCLNTDNKTVSNTNYNKEIEFLEGYTPLTEEDICRMSENAIRGAFISNEEKERLLKKLYI